MKRELNNLKDAVDFFRRVRASTEDEKNAVGHDHWDWLVRAAEAAADAHIKVSA